MLEFVLQPLDRIDVEMVGRLVEHEQVGIGDQCPGQRDPLLLPPELVTDRSITSARPRRCSAASLPATSDRGAHTAGWKGRGLIDGGHGDTTTSTNRAGLRLAGAGDDRQQGRLAGAVDADHAQPVAARYRDGDIGEQRPQRAAHADTFDVDEDHVARLRPTPQPPSRNRADERTSPDRRCARRPPAVGTRLTRALARLSGTIRSVSATIDPTERRWHELVAQSLAAAEGDHRPPLWVVLGDSTAQGIGASSIDHGWVSRLHALYDAGGPMRSSTRAQRRSQHT